MTRIVNVLFPATTEELKQRVNQIAPGLLLIAALPDTTTEEGASRWLKDYVTENELRTNEFIVPGTTILELSNGLWRATVTIEAAWDGGGIMEYAVKLRESDKSYSIQEFANLMKAKDVKAKYGGKILYREAGTQDWLEYQEVV